MATTSPNARQRYLWAKFGHHPLGLEAAALVFGILNLIMSIIQAVEDAADLNICQGKWHLQSYGFYGENEDCTFDDAGYNNKAEPAVLQVILPIVGILVVVFDLFLYSRASRNKNLSSRSTLILSPIYAVCMSIFLLLLWTGHLLIIMFVGSSIDERDSSIARLALRYSFVSAIMIIYIVYTSIAAAAIDLWRKDKLVLFSRKEEIGAQ